MLHICTILFFIYNFTDLLVASFEKNTNKIINIIDTNFIDNKFDIYYERRIKSNKRMFSKLQKFRIPYDIYAKILIH